MKRKRVFATLTVLGTVLQQLTDEIPEEVGCLLQIFKYTVYAVICYIKSIVTILLFLHPSRYAVLLSKCNDLFELLHQTIVCFLCS